MSDEPEVTAHHGCGARDELRLHHGAGILPVELRRWRVPHVFQELNDGHMGIAYRYDRSREAIGRVGKRIILPQAGSAFRR